MYVAKFPELFWKIPLESYRDEPDLVIVKGWSSSECSLLDRVSGKTTPLRKEFETKYPKAVLDNKFPEMRLTLEWDGFIFC